MHRMTPFLGIHFTLISGLNFVKKAKLVKNWHFDPIFDICYVEGENTL